MKLYFSGCSFTYGDELANPTTNAWPILVANHYNCNYINDAISGNTNDRIVSRTILNINDYDMFFIAWTSYARFTRYYHTNNTEVNFNPNLSSMDFSSLNDNQTLKHNKNHYIKYGNLHYKYWYTNLHAFKLYLQQIITLQSLLTLHNKKFLMMNTFQNELVKWLSPKENFIPNVSSLISSCSTINNETLYEEHHKIQKMVKLIDTSKFIEWNEWYISKIVNDPNVPVGPNGHMLEEGHRITAKKVIDYAQI